METQIWLAVSLETGRSRLMNKLQLCAAQITGKPQTCQRTDIIYGVGCSKSHRSKVNGRIASYGSAPATFSPG